MKHNLEAALIQAVSRHDMPALMALVEDQETMLLLRHSVLLWVDVPELTWFWRAINSDEKAFLDLCHNIRQACTGKLLLRNYTCGTDFSWAEEEGLPTLWVNGGAHAHLLRTLLPERYNTARIILREDP